MAMTTATKPTKEQRILDLLSDGREHHMRELNAIAFRYGGRFFDLRRRGYIIETRKIARGEFVYRLVTEGQREMAL